VKDSWHNNRISKELNEHYKHDFSICDLDGVVRWSFVEKGKDKHRFIVYESKNKGERVSQTQLQTLRILNENMDWLNFDKFSGCYIIEIIKYKEERPIEMDWYNLYGELIRTTTMDKLYKIFSGKPFNEK